MKIKANNANSPIWKDVYSHSMLPEQLQPLYEMATNLWWVWNHEGAKLFGKIDSELWASTEGNPVLLLQSLSYKRIEEILADDVLMPDRCSHRRSPAACSCPSPWRSARPRSGT